jgi:glycosyltransferase involved in cell wall biosynthesis
MPSDNRSNENNKAKKKRQSHDADLISVVIPCFNESKVIHLFYPELKRVLRALRGVRHEMIFVDDGSTDDTLAELNQIGHKDPCVRVCSFSRNFGHQIAITAGLDAAKGNAAITMDSDLQHPPALIPQMVEKWKQGYDIVSAVRDSTEGVSYFKRATSSGFYSILNLLSETRIPTGAADFNLFSRRAYLTLRAMPERHRFLRGMTSWMGFDRAFLKYAAPKRAAGESKYSVLKMTSLALDGIFSFSAAPLRIAMKVGLIITFLGSIYLIYILARYFLGGTVPGWASLIGVTLILGGVNLVSIGLVGQYLSRIFEEVKGRPTYIFKQEPTRAVEPRVEQVPKERASVAKASSKVLRRRSATTNDIDNIKRAKRRSPKRRARL